MFNHKIVDTITGEETLIPFSDEEAAEMAAKVAQVEALEKANQEAAEAAASKKAAALAKLSALGLEIDDLKALGLG